MYYALLRPNTKTYLTTDTSLREFEATLSDFNEKNLQNVAYTNSLTPTDASSPKQSGKHEKLSGSGGERFSLCLIEVQLTNCKATPLLLTPCSAERCDLAEQYDNLIEKRTIPKAMHIDSIITVAAVDPDMRTAIESIELGLWFTCHTLYPVRGKLA